VYSSSGDASSFLHENKVTVINNKKMHFNCFIDLDFTTKQNSQYYYFIN